MNCKYCGSPVENGAVFCANCGMEITPEPAATDSVTDGVYCAQCGTEIFPEDTFCPECGAPVNGNSVSGAPEYVSGGYGDGVIYDNNNTYNNGYNNYNNGYNMQPPIKPEKKSKTALIIIIIVTVVVAAAAAIAIWKWDDISDMLGINSEPAATETVKGDSDKSAKSKDSKASKDDDLSDDEKPVRTEAPTEEPESEYLYESDSKYITTSELDGYSKDEIRLILNEMYARHGYIFTTDEFRRYFESKPWYHGDTSSQDVALSRFNSIEKSNRQTIMDYEEAKGWR
ncbi:MAG: YARHG domain-containing protein [Oscillospiraceae bacterium]|nr:YARHG domain-containing protein [Oscillospiraceae bacterium]